MIQSVEITKLIGDHAHGLLSEKGIVHARVNQSLLDESGETHIVPTDLRLTPTAAFELGTILVKIAEEVPVAAEPPKPRARRLLPPGPFAA